jgi:hypothetical protein
MLLKSKRVGSGCWIVLAEGRPKIIEKAKSLGEIKSKTEKPHCLYLLCMCEL